MRESICDSILHHTSKGYLRRKTLVMMMMMTDEKKKDSYMYLHKNEFSLFLPLFFSLYYLPDNEQSSAFTMVQLEKEYYVFFLF